MIDPPSAESFCSLIRPLVSLPACNPKPVSRPSTEPDMPKVWQLNCMEHFYESHMVADDLTGRPSDEIYSPDFFYRAFKECEPPVSRIDAAEYGGWITMGQSERLSIAHQEIRLSLSPILHPIPAIEPEISRHLTQNMITTCKIMVPVVLLAVFAYWASRYWQQMRKREVVMDGLVENDDESKDDEGGQVVNEEFEYRRV